MNQVLLSESFFVCGQAWYLCNVFICLDILLFSIAHTSLVQCTNIMTELINVNSKLVKFQTLCQVLSYTLFYYGEQAATALGKRQDSGSPFDDFARLYNFHNN